MVDERLDEISDRLRCGPSNVHELDSFSVEHRLPVDLANRRLNGSAVDDDGAAVECQPSIVPTLSGAVVSICAPVIEICDIRIGSTTAIPPVRSSSNSTLMFRRRSVDIAAAIAHCFFGL